MTDPTDNQNSKADMTDLLKPIRDLGFVPSTERLRRAREGFLKATSTHELTVIRDDGIYRHLRVGKPGTNMWHWQIVTWPGHLAITGDVGEGYVFSRVTDMLDFFRSGAADSRSIDFHYWAEKVLGRSRKDLRTFSEDAFLEAVYYDLFVEGPVDKQSIAAFRKEGRDDLAEAAQTLRAQVWEDAKSASDPYGAERGYYEWLADYAIKVPDTLQDVIYLRDKDEWAPWADDYYEMQIEDWDHQFLIACWAIALTVHLWDEHVKAHGSADGFVLVEGGVVQNDAGSTPVYDLDCLQHRADAQEVDELFWRMVRDPNRSAIRPHLKRVLKVLEQIYPEPEALAEARNAFERQGRPQ